MQPEFEPSTAATASEVVCNGIYDVLTTLPGSAAISANAQYRVLHIEVGRSDMTREIYLFKLDGKGGPPISMRLQRFQDLLTAGDIRVGQYSSAYWMSDDDAELNEKAIETREYCWALIAPLVRDPDITGIFLADFRGRLIKTRIEAIRLDGMGFIKRELPDFLAQKWIKTGKLPKPTKKQVYDALYAYWKDGQVKNALLGKYANCGSSGRREPGTKKRGAPNLLVRSKHDVDALGVNVDQEHLRNIQFAYDTFKIGCHLTKADAYRRMQSACYSASVERDGLIYSELLPADQYPTWDQFAYWCRAYEKDFKVRVAAAGKKNFEQKKRQTSGTVTDNVQFPAEIFEIDASIANIWLVSRFNRHRLVGKPVVYFVVDRFSSMITGIHVALEGPSWNAARLALFWTMRDKVEYCAHYGITITADQWPCREKPDLLVSDSGEMLSRAAKESLQNKLEIESEFNGYGRPERKPLVESRFRFVQGKTEWTAGAYKENAKKWKEETGLDPRLDAALTLREFTQILILEVLDHNNNQRIETLPYAMRMAEVSPYRRDVYNWGLQKLRPSVRREDDIARLYRSLLPHRMASITGDGLYFDNTYYVPTVEDYRELLSLARVRRMKAKVFYDPNFPREVWVEVAGREGMHKWVWADHESRSWEDCSAPEIAEEIAVGKIQAQLDLTQERAQHARKHEVSQSIEDKARRAKSEAVGFKFKTDRTKGVAEARAIEKAAMRAENGPDQLIGRPTAARGAVDNESQGKKQVRPSRRDKAAKFFVVKSS
jgi:putative transposase